MSYGIKLHVWGERACFTRPEMKVERVSYDIMTPSAARGILEAIYWRPEIRWIIDSIHVLKPIRFESIRRNEVKSIISVNKVKTAMKQKKIGDNLHLSIEDDRQQRAATILRDVAYIIESHFDLVNETTPDLKQKEGKHLDIFNRRARKGQCFHMPYFGVREFPVNFRLIEANDGLPIPDKGIIQMDKKDLGWMLYDLDFKNNMVPQFFRAIMKEGIVDTKLDTQEMKA